MTALTGVPGRTTIVHVGDSESGGGAANAMSRLHASLLRLGADSHVLVRDRAATGTGVETIATRGDADELFAAVREAVVHQYVDLNRTSLTNTHFSLYIDGADASRAPVVASSDVVHLHWTASFQTPADVRALLQAKPVVWTLHDLAPLTGGCHFSAGCDGYTDACAACPQLARDPFGITAITLADKKAFWAGSRPTFVAPSRYIAELARRSAVAHEAHASIVHIAHGIDVEVFPVTPKAAARGALGLPPDGLYVLCGSNHNAEQRKGLRLVEQVLAAASAGLEPGASRPTLLTVGEPKLDVQDLDGWNVVQLGRVPLDVMPQVYAAADVFLHPALEDNAPCMVLESLSCGTPAIAFDVGGVGEMVRDGVAGRLTPAGDAAAMGAALSAIFRDPRTLERLSAGARAHVEENFSDTTMAQKHAELYADVVANHAPPAAFTDRPRTSRIDEIFSRWAGASLVAEIVLARTRTADLVEQSRAQSDHIAYLSETVRANSERIAALERTSADLASDLANHSRQVHEKQAELDAIHEVAQERKALADTLHAAATRIQSQAASLQQGIRDRDDLIERLEQTIDEQRAEIELVHRAAADRQVLIEDLHSVAEQRAAMIDELVAHPGEQSS